MVVVCLRKSAESFSLKRESNAFVKRRLRSEKDSLTCGLSEHTNITDRLVTDRALSGKSALFVEFN